MWEKKKFLVTSNFSFSKGFYCIHEKKKKKGYVWERVNYLGVIERVKVEKLPVVWRARRLSLVFITNLKESLDRCTDSRHKI